MDPFTMLAVGMMVAGAGTSLFGGMSGASSQKKISQYDMQIAQQELLADRQRKNAMELDARRKRTENIRQMQLAASVGMQRAVAQGAQFGSGLQSGLGQVTSSGYWNDTGIQQNLEIGRNIFGINEQISGLKIKKAEAGGDLAEAQGIQSLGGSMMKIGSAFASLGGGGTTASASTSGMPWLSGVGDDYT